MDLQGAYPCQKTILWVGESIKKGNPDEGCPVNLSLS
jgi:hypothetical protein